MSTSVDIEAFYHKHLPAAQALSASSILTNRVDADLAIVNIETAMHVITEHANDIPTHFPKVDPAMLQVLPEIASSIRHNLGIQQRFQRPRIQFTNGESRASGYGRRTPPS